MTKTASIVVGPVVPAGCAAPDVAVFDAAGVVAVASWPTPATEMMAFAALIVLSDAEVPVSSTMFAEKPADCRAAVSAAAASAVFKSCARARAGVI